MDDNYLKNNSEEILSYAESLVIDCIDNEVFSECNIICEGFMGAAQFLAIIAFPDNVKRRNDFYSATMNAYCRTRTNFDQTKLPKEIIVAWHLKPLRPWKRINQTISGGVSRLEKSFHAYHGYKSYEKSIIDGNKTSFEDVFSHISTVYESKISKVSGQATGKNGDSQTRIKNLLKVHKRYVPVIHLIDGLVYSLKLLNIGVNDIGQLTHYRALIENTGWLEKAVIEARVKLSTELLDYEIKINGGWSHVKLVFNPSKIIHVEL